jgi:Fe-S oxidoreductase
LLAPRLNASNRWKSFEGSTMDIELPFDFKEFLKLLNENGVRVLLIGGYAVV